MNEMKKAEGSDEYEEFLAQVVASEKKSQIQSNMDDWGEYLIFKQSTTYIPGDNGVAAGDLSETL